ncbi:MAG: YciI family protein [Ilyomonas sp.]
MPQFLVLADDYKDANALSRRLNVRETHLARMRVEKSAGRFIVGGAKLDDEKRMVGSMLVVDLLNIAEVETWLNEDVYVTEKVWEKIEIIPFKIAEV